MRTPTESGGGTAGPRPEAEASSDVHQGRPDHLLRIGWRFARAVAGAAPRQAAASALVATGLGLTEGAGLLLLVPLLALVGISAGGGALAGVVARVRSLFVLVGVQPTLPLVLLLYVTVAVGQSGLQRAQTMLTAEVQGEFVTALRTRIYRALANARWTFHAHHRSADARHTLTSEVGRVGAAAAQLLSVCGSVAIAIVYFGVALRVSPTMTGLVVLCGAALAWVMRGQFARSREDGEASSALSRRLYGAISEHLAAMKTAKSYGRADDNAEEVVTFARAAQDGQLAVVAHWAGSRQRLAIGVPVMLAVVVYLAYGVIGLATAPLLLLLFLFARLMPRLADLYQGVQELVGSLPSFEQVSVFEERCLAAAESRPAALKPVAIGAGVRFEGVRFAYPHAVRPAVGDLTLFIPAGATTAIVGPSGAGKTTVADLLLGLLVPAAGRIFIGADPLDAERLAAWRGHIGYVAQETFLFHDTVRRNLCWARPEATDDDLWRALRLAAAEGFVAGLSDGLDTVLGDRGVRLSGGERQRLSLARALVRQPSVLVLDEATSNLDSENERRIQQAIEGLHDQMTIVIITHRLATIRRADVIHVLDQGTLVQSGPWSELMRDGRGRFRALAAAQGIDPEGPAPASTGDRGRTEEKPGSMAAAELHFGGAETS